MAGKSTNDALDILAIVRSVFLGKAFRRYFISNVKLALSSGDEDMPAPQFEAFKQEVRSKVGCGCNCNK